jgi:uncharacterized Zn finger protein (UPF0148 family)
MGRARTLQPTLPLVERDGQTHRRDCDCPRCDAGFRPSDRERALAARRWEEQRARAEAEVALAKKRARDREKALRTTLALEEQAQLTAERLHALAEMRERLKADHRLEALLASRKAGRPIDEALAEAERQVDRTG